MITAAPPRAHPGYGRIIQANGASIVFPLDRGASPPWIPHKDPALRRWMGDMGYTSIEDIPATTTISPPADPDMAYVVTVGEALEAADRIAALLPPRDKP